MPLPITPRRAPRPAVTSPPRASPAWERHGRSSSRRASQRPGASSSESVGVIDAGRPTAGSAPPAPARSTTPGAERRARLVVLALQGQAEQLLDEAGRLAALEAVPGERLVDPPERRHQPVADPAAGRRRRTPRARSGSARSAASMSAWRGDVIAPSSSSGRSARLWSASGSAGSTSPRRACSTRRVDLVRRDVVGREAHEPLAHPRHRARGGVDHLVQRDAEAQVGPLERPRRLERVEVRDDEAQRRLVGRSGAAGRSGRGRAAPGSPIIEPACTPSSSGASIGSSAAIGSPAPAPPRPSGRRRHRGPRRAWPRAPPAPGAAPRGAGRPSPPPDGLRTGAVNVAARPVSATTWVCAARASSSSCSAAADSMGGSVSPSVGDVGRDLGGDLPVDRAADCSMRSRWFSSRWPNPNGSDGSSPG